MYAVIITGGKQYKVSAGQTLDVEKLEGSKGDKVSLPVIMVADGEQVTAGADCGTKSVEAEIVSQGKGAKIVVYKYKPKKNIRKKQGHRQPFTTIKIVSIV